MANLSDWQRNDIRPLLDELRRLTVAEADAGNRRDLYGPGNTLTMDRLRLDATRFTDMVTLLPPLGRSRLRVLELGANPYILTYVLARLGIAVTAGGHPLDGTAEQRGEEWVQFRRQDSEVVATVPLVRFNAESDQFPFPDGRFDVVICGELIEHLPSGPDRMLFECCRVLTSGGLLLLSTPNAVSLARRISLARGTNIDSAFSSQGIYSRHNRNYSLAELRDLLRGNGFSVQLERGLMFVHRRTWYAPGRLGALKWTVMAGLQGLLASQPRRLRRFSDGLLIAATKVGGPYLYRPSWLFGALDGIPMVATGNPGASAPPQSPPEH